MEIKRISARDSAFINFEEIKGDERRESRISISKGSTSSTGKNLRNMLSTSFHKRIGLIR